MATKKKTKYSASNPSPAQLRARRKFAVAAKARAKAARAAKRAAGAKTKVARKSTVARKRNYTTSGPVRVGGKTYPPGTHFPKQRYTFTAGGRTLMFSTKAEAETIAKRTAEQNRRAVKVKKEELNKNGVTYKSAGGFTVRVSKANPVRTALSDFAVYAYDGRKKVFISHQTASNSRAAVEKAKKAWDKYYPEITHTGFKNWSALKSNPSVKGAARYIVVKNNRKVGAISYRLKSAATQAARKVGGTVKVVISGVTKRNGFWRERLADKIQGKKLKPLRQVAREKVADKIRGKKRNAEERDAAHPIHVRQYWQGRKGFKTQWQRAHEAGQKQLFSVKNGKKKNGLSAAKAAYKEFTGKTSRKVSNNYAPKGSGARGTLAAMGQLKKIHVKGRTPLDFKGGPNAPLLARDPKTNQMFVLGKQYKLTLPRRNPTGMEDLGEITKLEYEAQKVHLGDSQTVTYFHRMGEEGGEKPHCLVNSEGLIVISGGDYSIGPEGIRN